MKGRRRNTTKMRLAKAVAKVAAVTVLLLFVSGCMNPFSGVGSSSDGSTNSETVASDQAGRLEIRIDDQVEGSTVVPDGTALAESIAYYRLTLTHADGVLETINRDNLQPTDFPLSLSDVPAATWNATLDGFDASDRLVGRSPVTSVVVTATGASLTMTVSALQTGKDATVRYDLSWPAARVDGASVSLYRVESLTDPLGTGTVVSGFSSGIDYNLNVAAGSLSVDTQLPSGTYYMAVNLSLGGVVYPPVYEAIQLYDHLTSSKTVALTTSEFTDPPTAPTNLTYTLTGDGTYQLNWTDQSNMETEFRIYENSQAATPLVNAAGVTDRALVGTPGDTVTWIVTAANDFGESSPVSVSATVVGNQTPDSPTNGNTWVLINSGPGTLQWNDDGGDRWDVYFSTTELDVQNLDPGVRIAADVDVASVAMPTLQRGTNYFWRVVSKRSDATGGVPGPVWSFASRPAQINVNYAGGDDVTGDGSTGSPFFTLARAMNEAVDAADLASADTIRFTDTIVYQDGEFQPTKSVVIEGGWATDFSARNDVTVETNRTNWTDPIAPMPDVVITIPAGVDLRLDGLNIVNQGTGTDVKTVVTQGASQVTITNTALTAQSPSPTADVTILELGAGANLSLSDSRIDINESGTDTNTVKGIANLSGADIGAVEIVNTVIEESTPASVLRHFVHITNSGTGSVDIDGSTFTFSDHTANTVGIDVTAPIVRIGANSTNTVTIETNGGRATGIFVNASTTGRIENNTLNLNAPSATGGTDSVGVSLEGGGILNVDSNSLNFGDFADGIDGIIVTGTDVNLTIDGNLVDGGNADTSANDWRGINAEQYGSGSLLVQNNTIQNATNTAGEVTGILAQNTINGTSADVLNNTITGLRGGPAWVRGINVQGDAITVAGNTVSDLESNDPAPARFYGPLGIEMSSPLGRITNNDVELSTDQDNEQVGIAAYSTNTAIDRNTIILGPTADTGTVLFSKAILVEDLDIRLTNNIVAKVGSIGSLHRYRGINLSATGVDAANVNRSYIYNNTLLVDAEAVAVAAGEWVGMEFSGGVDGLQPDVRNNIIIGLNNAAGQDASALKWYEGGTVSPYNISNNYFAGIGTLVSDGAGGTYPTAADLDPFINGPSGGDSSLDGNAITFDALYQITSAFDGAAAAQDLGNSIPGAPYGQTLPGVDVDRFGNTRTPVLGGGVSIGAQEID